MACVRYITVKDKQVESKLYNDLRDSYGDDVGGNIYEYVHGNQFAKAFGDWRMFPEKFADKLDENGEPLLSEIAPTKESNELYSKLVNGGYIYPTAINGLYPRNTKYTKGELMNKAGSSARVIGDHVMLEGRNHLPSEVFLHDDTLIGTKPADVAAEEKWFKEKFGNKIDFNVTKRLVDGHAMGKFQKGAVYMYENAVEGTAFHEAFHAVSQLYLTGSQRNGLYDELRNREGKEYTDKQAEEILADEFADYILLDGKMDIPKSTPKKKGFFAKLFNMIKEFFFGPTQTIEDIYKNINAGLYKEPIRLTSRAVKFFEGTSKDAFYKSEEITAGTEVLELSEKKALLGALNKYYMDALFAEGKPEAFTDPKINSKGNYQGAIIRMAQHLVNNGEEIQNALKKDDDGLKALRMRYGTILTNPTNQENLIKMHKESLAKYDIEVYEKQVDLDIDPEGNPTEQGRNHIIESIRYNTKDGVPRAVKLLVGTLTEVNNTRTTKLDNYGFPSLVNYDNMYNFLAVNLAGLPAEWNIIKAKLQDLADKKPEMLELLKRLDTDTKEGMGLKIKFIQAFSKTKYNYILALYDKNDDKGNVGNITFNDGNSNKLNNKILDVWRSNLFDKMEGTEDLEGRIKEARQYLSEMDKTKKKGYKKAYLSAAYTSLGFDFTDTSVVHGILPIEGKNESGREMLESILTYIGDENIEKIDDLFSTKSGVHKRIKDLASIEAKQISDTVELQHVNAEGQTVYGITLNSYMTRVAGELNYIASLPSGERKDALKVRMPHLFNSTYAQDSFLLEQVLDGKKIDIGVLDGIKINSPGEQGAATKNLGPSDKYSQFFNATLNGHYSFLRAADRGIENIINIEGVKSITRGDKGRAYDMMHEYLKTEILTARDLYQSDLGKNIGYYRDMFNEDRGGDRAGLRLFTDIIGDNLKNKIENLVKVVPDTEYKNELEALTDDIYDAFDTYFERRFTEEKEEMVSLGLIVEGEKETYPGISAELLQGETFEDLMYKYIYDHQIMYIEQTKIFVGDSALYKTSDDFFKRMSMANSTKKVSATGADIDAYLAKHYPRPGKTAEDRQKIKTIIYEDVLVKSAYEKQLREIFKSSLIEDGFINDKGELNKEGSDFLEGMMSPYLEMEEGDAAGYIDLYEYRDLMLRAGDWTPGHDRAFDKVLKGTPLKPNELQYFQPLKTQYTGPLVGEDINNTKMYVHSGYKHALSPLLPAMYSNSRMKKLMDHMRENAIGISQFRSGNKFGTIVDLDTGKANSFYTENDKNKSYLNTDNLTYQTIDYKYFGIQLDIAPKVKTEITAGTQSRKLNLANIFQNGQVVDETLAADAREYIDIQSEIINLKTQALMDEMSIVAEGKGYRITNGDAFIEYLERASSDRDASDNIIKGIRALNKIDADGNSIGLNKIDTLLNKEKVENLLMALIDSNIIREKRAGGAKAQVPSTGLELSARSKDGELYTSNELKFYEVAKDKEGNEVLVGMEIAIPAPKELLKEYGSLAALNEALKDGKLGDHAEIVGFRIPTQAMNSIDVLKIKKFLPAEAGDIVVMPTEIVAKSGSDYDIDKLSIYFYATGKLSEIDKLQNRLLDVSKRILKHPYNRRQLLAPISDELLKDLVKDIRGLMGIPPKGTHISRTNIIEGKTNMDKYKYFLSGKAGVGQVAVHGTNHVLTQIANTYVKSPHAKMFFKAQTTEIDGITYPSLGYVKSTNGYWISESLSAFMNAYVDIAKDPYVFDLNAGNETANTIFYMLRLGVDPKWVARFMAQPAVQDYIKGRAISKSKVQSKSDSSTLRGDDFADAVTKSGLKVDGRSFKATIVSKNEKITQAELFGVPEREINRLIAERDIIADGYVKPSYEDLKSPIKKYYSGQKMTKEDGAFQLQMLDNFLEYQRQSNYLQKLIRATSPDTKGVGKSINGLLYRQEEKTEVLKYDKFFGNITPMFDKTFIGAFQKPLDVTESAYSKITIMQGKSVKATLDNMKRTVSAGKDGASAEKARNLVESEFLRYVLMTANTQTAEGMKHLGINLVDIFHHLMNKKNDNNTVKQIKQLKDGNHPTHDNKLKNNLFIKELIPILDREKQDNLKIFSKKVTVEKENDLLDSFDEIAAVDKGLAFQLGLITLVQSGVAMSPISFTRFISNDSLAKNILNSAINAIDEHGYVPDMGNYTQQFYRNNKHLIPKLRAPFNIYTGKNEVQSDYDLQDNMANFPYAKAGRYEGEGDNKIWREYLLAKTEVEVKTKNGIKKKVRFVESADEFLGDGIYMSSYRMGENKKEIFDTEYTKKCNLY